MNHSSLKCVFESYNYRMTWVEKDHNDHWVSTPLLCAGSPTTRLGCPEPHPAWPWMPPGMGHPQPPWATWSSASPPSMWKNFLSVSNLNLPCLSLKPFLLVLLLSTLVNSRTPSCLYAECSQSWNMLAKVQPSGSAYLLTWHTALFFFQTLE